MRVVLLTALAAAGLGLAGCIVIAKTDGPDDAEIRAAFGDVGGLEPLYAATVGPDGARVRVASNGCTNEDSFDVDVDRAGGENRYRVSLERENPDRCKALLVDGVELFFPRERLGLGKDAVIRLANPVAR